MLFSLFQGAGMFDSSRIIPPTTFYLPTFYLPTFSPPNFSCQLSACQPSTFNFQPPTRNLQLATRNQSQILEDKIGHCLSQVFDQQRIADGVPGFGVKHQLEFLARVLQRVYELCRVCHVNVVVNHSMHQQ